jgi:DNA-nicking Smr family endonuclease
MTQPRAHRHLVTTLGAAAAAGERLVLVVTGKGRKSPNGARAGVLKARFLDWIEAAPVNALIARVAPAGRRDGGDGAFYVFLKRKGAGEPPRR